MVQVGEQRGRKLSEARLLLSITRLNATGRTGHGPLEDPHQESTGDRAGREYKGWLCLALLRSKRRFFVFVGKAVMRAPSPYHQGNADSDAADSDHPCWSHV